MNYRALIVKRQWRIVANGEIMPEVFANGREVMDVLRKLRQGHTATTVATLTRRQQALREKREAGQ